LVRDGGESRLARVVSNPPHAGIEEILLRSIDRLRKADGTLVKGIATTPDGPQAKALLDNLYETNNLGFAYEPYAMGLMLDTGVLNLGDLVEMGKRFDLGGEIAEADGLVVFGGNILIDFKHGPGSTIKPDQVRRLKDALEQGRVSQVIYALKDGMGPGAAKTAIDDANAYLRGLLPNRWPPGVDNDPIRTLQGLGPIR
jgi:hypothetical protein